MNKTNVMQPIVTFPAATAIVELTESSFIYGIHHFLNVKILLEQV